jgi:hypothetical protein
MISDEQGQLLHDKATRGDELSADEHSQLQTWYEAQDKLEAVSLGTALETDTVASLQPKIDIALKQLTAITSHIQDVAAENKILRQEINRLRHQLLNSVNV